MKNNLKYMEGGDSTQKKEKKEKKESDRKKFWIATNSILLLLAIILVFATYKIVSNINRKDLPNNDVISDTNENEGKVRRKIDGVYVLPGQDNYYPVAIMIDNYGSARPQAGLFKANLVIEAEAEGGITRYMAIYASDEEIKKIGPVRSARPYFADWANEYSAAYGHCGGSPEALVKISQNSMIDFDEFYNGKYYWRDSNGNPSHDLFTSSDLISKYLDDKKLEEGKYFSWYYKDDESIENRPEKSEIKIDYLLEIGKVKWTYDKTSNLYTRYLAGTLHEDSEGSPVTAKNIIIQVVPAEEIDEQLRLRMEYIGEGQAKTCLDGICSDAVWKKNNSRSRTRFYDTNGEEIKFNAGTTWVEVTRPDIKVEITE